MVLGMGRADCHLADTHLVTDVDLAHVREASQEAAGANWHHDRHAGAEPSQRGPVEMVEMDVREKSRVDPSEFGGAERHAAPQVPYPVPKDGVRQKADPV